MVKDFLQGKWLKHPLHPIFVHIPTALWPAALVFDILSRLGVGGNAVVRTSFYGILLGLLAALFAIPTGLADWSDIRREKPAWKIGLYHMSLNLIVTVVWAVNLGLRLGPALDATAVPNTPLVLSILGTLLLLVSGSLGEIMIYGYGINVARLSKKKWRRIAEAGGARIPPA
ncbi:MAG: DUF2231 domain-containing protein [Ardenticatenaceae bacterium]|nr:DUF2231 domain-containing protein [Ardenticatenaceae bacterium]HBY95534.1 hypothetical protein [Chloroflexota bacterium]